MPKSDTYKRWRTLQDRLPEGEVGIARLEHFTVSDEESRWSFIRPGGVDAGDYIRLRLNGGVMMSNTYDEYRSNWDVLHYAHGDVLIGGLGMGAILDCILEKDTVRSVTVIEKSSDVIELVKPHFASPKLTVVHADVFGWKAPKGQKWNTIYFDIWQDICTGNLEGIANLHQRFKGRLDRSDDRCWMDSWHADHLRYLRRSDRWR